MGALLAVENIARSYGRTVVLNDVSLTLGSGELVGITGENGSGKTTLMHIITGMLKPDRGRVQRNGSLGYCPQEILLFENLTVWEHFRCWSVGYGLDNSEWEPRMQELLGVFRFEKYLDKRVAQLSGGTKQKLNLALAMLHEPRLLVLDEPYAGFDWETYLHFWEYAETLLAAGQSLLVVSHFISDHHRFHRIYNLQNGCLQ
jgi:ABC-type multidrug transport system ATPase subunit